MKPLICLLILATSAHAEGLVVCAPGGTVTAKQAAPTMEKLLRVLERLGGEPAGSLTATFEAEAEACRRALAARPALALLSLGLYLEHRASHHLVPLVRPVAQGRTTETLRVVARKGGPANLADLKGKRLTGPALDEAAYLERIVFRGALDATTERVPERRALKALRQLHAGEVAAVILNDTQHAGLPALPFAADLQVIHTFEPQPLVGLVVDETRVDAARRARLVAALTGLCGDAEGKGLCELFGLDGFEAVDPQVYAEPIAHWGAP